MSLIPGWSTSFWTKAKGAITLEPDHVLKWENPYGSAGQIYSRAFPVKPDGQYRAKVAFKANDTKKMRCSVRWMDADFKALKNNRGRRVMTNLDLLLPSSGKWVEGSKTFKAPKAARFANLYLLNSKPRSICYKSFSVAPSKDKK